MKKRVALLLVAGLMAAFLLAGCGSSSEEEEETEAVETEAAEDEEDAADSGDSTVYEVEFDMMGDSVPATVTITGDHYVCVYEFYGSEITLEGTVVEGGSWTLDEDNANGYGEDVIEMVQEAVEALQ